MTRPDLSPMPCGWRRRFHRPQISRMGLVGVLLAAGCGGGLVASSDARPGGANTAQPANAVYGQSTATPVPGWGGPASATGRPTSAAPLPRAPQPIGGTPSTAVGTTPGATGSALPLPTPFPPYPVVTPAAGNTIALTQADIGRRITVSPGTTIVVDLGGGSFASAWGMPYSTDQAVVRFMHGSASNNGNASGVFDAVSPGEAEIDSNRGPRCPPACTGPSRIVALFEIAVSA